MPYRQEDKDFLDEFFMEFHYKPKWEFWTITRRNEYGLPYMDLFIRMQAELEDTYNPGYYIPVGQTVWVPESIFMATDREQVFMNWLHGVILSMEKHECDEWFMVKGHRPFDPHRKKAMSV